MQDERPEASGLADFAAQLAALTPRAEIDRDRLMFEAGARTGRRLLVMNRALAAACVLLAVTTVASLARPERGNILAQEEQQPHEPVNTPTKAAPQHGEENGLPNQLVAADGGELAAAIAEGRDDLRPARLREVTDSPSNETGPSDNAPARPKPSRELMREYLKPDGKYL